MTQKYQVRVSMNQAAVVKTGLVMKQGDFGMQIEIEVLDFDATGTTPQIVFRKAMGAVESTTITVSGNKYTYTFVGTELDTPGKCICDLKLKNSTTQRISTASFAFEVVADTLDGLAEETSSYSDTIAQIAEDIEADVAAQIDEIREDLKPVVITQSSDLNSYTDTGKYVSETPAITSSLSHCPVTNIAFAMDVTKIGASVTQTIYPAREEGGSLLYRRSRSSTTWGDWYRYTTESELEAVEEEIDDLKPKSIQQNDDLNNYTNTGKYVSTEPAITTSLSHCPISNIVFALEVEKIGVSVTQTIYPGREEGGSLLYRRSRSSTTWGNWYRYATENELTALQSQTDTKISTLQEQTAHTGIEENLLTEGDEDLLTETGENLCAEVPSIEEIARSNGSTNEQLGEVTREVENLEDLVSELNIRMDDDQIQFIDGYNIPIQKTIGETATISLSTVADYCYAIVDVTNTDGLILTVKSGYSPKAYCFLDANNVILKISNRYATLHDTLVTVPEGAKWCIVNSTIADLETCYKVNKSNYKYMMGKFDNSEMARVSEALAEVKDAYVSQLSNIINSIGLESFTDKVNTVADPTQYIAWPFVESVKGNLMCLYAKCVNHTDNASGAFYKTSPNGIVWSAENTLINEGGERENVTGKGLDSNGNLLFWLRIGFPNGNGNVKFYLYKYDGKDFKIISEPTFGVLCEHIGDIFSVPGVGLMCFFNNYVSNNRSYGILKSSDNGVTWTQVVIESGLSYLTCPVEISGAYIGNSKILALGRKDAAEDPEYMFQLQSADKGENWTKEYTNIGDIWYSTPGVIYDSTLGNYTVYYYNREDGNLNVREALASAIWDNPTTWPESEAIAQGVAGEGNVNVTVFNGHHVVSYYTGTSSNTGIYCILR